MSKPFNFHGDMEGKRVECYTHSLSSLKTFIIYHLANDVYAFDIIERRKHPSDGKSQKLYDRLS